MIKISYISVDGENVRSRCIKLEDPREALDYAESLRIMKGISYVSVIWDLLEELCTWMEAGRPQCAHLHSCVKGAPSWPAPVDTRKSLA